VKLEAPNKVTCLEGCNGEGTFTMVYDEGFDIKVGGKSMFAFFDYSAKAGTDYRTGDDVSAYDTNCGMTRTGWSHADEEGSKKWSCWNAKLVDPLDPHQLHHKESRQGALEPAIVSPIPVSPSFIVESVKISPDLMYIHDDDLIAAQNADPSTWNARRYPHFEGKSMREMYMLLGSAGHEVFRTSTPRTRAVLESSLVEVSAYPESFDWRDHNIETPVANQGACGSCYAVATMDVATMRYMIKKGIHTGAAHHRETQGRSTLSMEDIIERSFYNQGCAGGYPFLVAKHGRDEGFVFKTCANKAPVGRFAEVAEANASFQVTSDCSERVMVSNFGYIGGYYGASSEEAMMKEIKENGPIMAAFEAPASLFVYKSGVFTGDKAPEEERMDNWEKTNHAVVVMGWGKDQNTGEKYWIVKNSWGKFWGDKGYFKIKKGSDECAFESMGVTLELS